MEQGWRTLLVENSEKLRMRDGCLLAEGETPVNVPLGQLSAVMIDSAQVTVTAALLAELSSRHISVIFCDRKHQPVSELLSFSDHSHAAERLSEQCAWSDANRALVWKSIVEQKLRMQCSLLSQETGAVPAGLFRCVSAVLPNDTDNREGTAAGVYFRALFGNRFRRHSEDEANAALNYGYAILRSEMERILILHGYQPALGLHHRSGVNPHNLACDLMEPFRPFVDRIVARSSAREMSREYRMELISVRQKQVQYRGVCPLSAAMERFALDVLAVLRGEDREIAEVNFDRAS